MPTLTRWYIKSSLLYLIAAFVAGFLLAARVNIGGLGPVYFHLFMVGWVTQIIFGVAFWMFPKFNKENPRGYERLGWVTYGLLNSGLVLRVIAEPLNGQQPGTIWGWLLVISAVLQWIAGLCFVYNTWPRVHGGPRRQGSSHQ